MALTLDGPAPPLPGPEGNPIALTGGAAEAYLERLDLAVRGARLNAFFPPEKALRAHLSFLAPSGCEALYETLHLSPRSGLPSARDILRVKIDRDIASEILADAQKHGSPAPQSRAARRVAYHGRLAQAEIMATNRMRVELRQQEPAHNRARFRVVFDRFDIASCQFVRYTIMLSQRDRFWRQSHVIVDDAELAAPTESFRRIVSRLVSDEAEIAFVLLSEIPGIAVEDVRRCRVGPMLMPGVELGQPVQSLFAAAQSDGHSPWILCFPEDRAGIEVADHASSDPLAPLLREAVSADSRTLLDAKADQLDYRVAKSRKFVCSSDLRGPLARLCRDLGAPSIVRGA